MTYLVRPNFPRIVTIDCNDAVVDALRANGYDLEEGFSGFFTEHPAIDVPPLEEKDLLIVDLDPGWTPRPWKELFPTPSLQDPNPANPHLRDSRPGHLFGFEPAYARGGVVLCLLEGDRLLAELSADGHSTGCRTAT